MNRYQKGSLALLLVVLLGSLIFLAGIESTPPQENVTATATPTPVPTATPTMTPNPTVTPTPQITLSVKEQGTSMGTVCNIDVTAENKGTVNSTARLKFNGVPWNFSLVVKGRRSANIAVPFHASKGWTNVTINGDIDGLEINETKRIYCSSSSGGSTAPATATPTPTATATPTPTATATPTPTATATPTPHPTCTATPSPTATPKPPCVPKIALHTEKVGEKTLIKANFSNQGSSVCTGGGTRVWFYLTGKEDDVSVSETFQSGNVDPGYETPGKVYDPETGMLDWNARILDSGESGWIGAYLKVDDEISVKACINAAELDWNQVCTRSQNLGD